MEMKRFNIRVYGIWIDEEEQVLLADEYCQSTYMTKFPGGGLQLGEGTRDGLIREWQEELGVDIEILDHFYTTDFFQPSAFHVDAQIISIYYLVKPLAESNHSYTEKPFDFEELKEGAEAFRKIALAEISEDGVTFPIDKKVVSLLLSSNLQ